MKKRIGAIIGIFVAISIVSQGLNFSSNQEKIQDKQIPSYWPDKIVFGLGRIYAKSTGEKDYFSNNIWLYPRTKTAPPCGIWWWFDGSGIDPPRAKMKGFLLTLSQGEVRVSGEEEIIGPQHGIGILLGGMVDVNWLEIRAIGALVVFNYTEVRPNITNIYPNPGASNVSIKANFTWSLTFPYIGKEIEYTIKIIPPLPEPAKEFRVKNKEYLDLGETNYTLRYNTSYRWEIKGKCDTGDILPSPEIGDLWFITQPDPNPPYKPECASPPDNGSNVRWDKPLLAWYGGDPDEYDLVKYRVYVNISKNVDENSPIEVITDYFPWNESVFWYVIPTLQPNTTYYWKVIAEDWGGKKSESEIFTFRTRE